MPTLTGDVVTNYLKNVRANGLGPRTLVVSISKTDMTNAQVNTIVNYMTTSHGSAGTGDSAFVVAGFGTATGAAFVAGTTDVVYVALQGTGDITVGADYAGVTGATTALVAVFDQNYQ